MPNPNVRFFESPSKIAESHINAKHDELGGDIGILGKVRRETIMRRGGGAGGENGTPLKQCADKHGFFKMYDHGYIYFSPATGAHNLQGKILEKWNSLHADRGLLGYPIEDVRNASDNIGQFQRFQNGMIYWTPSTGAHEIHGTILEKWSDLGFERSWLGYPTNDEGDFSEGGRVSTFQNGDIYWWPDEGAIDLKEIRIDYTGLICFGETDEDQLSSADEPYVIMSIVSAENITSSFSSKIYENVNGGDAVPDLIEIYRGKPNGVLLNITLMEHDLGDPNKYKDAITDTVRAAAGVAATTIGFLPVIGPVLAILAAPFLQAIVPEIANDINNWLDLGDDNLGNCTLNITPKQMIHSAARMDNLIGKGVIGYKLETPIFSAQGASYKAYFGFVTLR
ncbi:MAG TPA: hypothetical protein VE978_26145 [Chitinophagales bacterium]|nr:hypothetical protein [Chitinophagales bacterium]